MVHWRLLEQDCGFGNTDYTDWMITRMESNTDYAEDMTSLNVGGGSGMAISGLILCFSHLALHWR